MPPKNLTTEVPAENNPEALREAEDFRPRRWLAGGHRMTLAGNFLPRKNLLALPEERLFSVEPEVQILCHCNWQPERVQAPTLIVVHGLEGSSNSQYVIGTANKAFAAGMNVVRMNMRNCGGTEKLTPTLYHSGLSGDVSAVVRALIEEEKLARIALAGYSMGGNLVLKCAGDWGTQAPEQLRGVCAISPAMDLAPSADALHQAANRIYEQKFLRGLMRRYRRKAALFPKRYTTAGLKRMRSVREFDDVITAPHSGFAGADDYYHRAAAARVIDQISVPTLIVHAKDDPFIRILPETRAKILANPQIQFIETEHGGHCAFLAEPNGYDGRWAERKIIDFVLNHSPMDGRR
ncbi:MAG TPA: alpha/beta fold hydrolase [Terriglobales bacterium]|nr:alpha/beta fold hydrolase [Terriglobales bacterium]